MNNAQSKAVRDRHGRLWVSKGDKLHLLPLFSGAVYSFTLPEERVTRLWGPLKPLEGMPHVAAE